MRSKSPYVPSFLYDQKIIKEVNSLIFFGATNYRDLRDTDKDSLVSIIIEILGADAETLFYGGDNYDVLLKNFSKYLKTSNTLDAYDTLSQMKKNSHDCYEHELDLLFDEVLEDRRSAA